jgi:hypothetical protein
MLLVGALGKLGKNPFSAGHGVQGREGGKWDPDFINFHYLNKNFKC